MTWKYHAVERTALALLEGFVTINTRKVNATYQFDSNMNVLWKSACYIKVWDDGRVLASVEHHLTPAQLSIVGGLCEQYWRAGPALPAQEKWRRIRRSKARPVASRVADFWVRADRDDPAYAAAHADYQVAVRASLEYRLPPSERVTLDPEGVTL